MALIRAGNQADFTFQVDGGPVDKLRVKSFHGSEHVSRLFQFGVELVSLDGSVDFDSILEKPAVLSLAGSEGKRVIHGIVSRFEQIGKSTRFTTYHAEVVPSLWLLSLRTRCRIFQNMSTKDIIAKVLKDAGIKDDQFKFSLKGSYPTREYCVQYRESDLDFVSRLMEEDGIFYYFDHAKDAEILNMLDSTGTTKPLPEKSAFVFDPSSGLIEKKEHIYDFRLAQSVRSGATRLKDYNYLKPSTSLESNTQADQGVDFEVYDYPGLYFESGEGNRLAQTRLEELRSARILGNGAATTRRLVPGFRFKLEEHPRADWSDKEYILLAVHSSGSQPQSEEEDGAGGDDGPDYQSSFECIPAAEPYRPQRLTPKPTVRGIQTARVVGPKGEKLYMDEHGRAKVMFHWDLEGKGDENCTCWVRVASLYAGNDHGVQFHPLVDDEVIVDFLEGDLDRPIVTGRLYNAANKPPLKPDDRIQNTILTPYQHRLHFDDKQASITLNTGGSETIYLGDEKEDDKYGNNIKLSTKDGHFLQLAKGDTHKGFMLKTENEHKAEIRDDPDPGIFLEDADGKLKIFIDIKNQTINLINDDQKEILLKCAGGKVTVKAAEITLDAENKITLKAGSEIDLKAPTVKVNGDQKVEITGMQVKVEGQTQLELTGMTAKFEGKTMGEVKGGGMLNISGGLVKIN